MVDTNAMFYISAPLFTDERFRTVQSKQSTTFRARTVQTGQALTTETRKPKTTRLIITNRTPPDVSAAAGLECAACGIGLLLGNHN